MTKLSIDQGPLEEKKKKKKEKRKSKIRNQENTRKEWKEQILWI